MNDIETLKLVQYTLLMLIGVCGLVLAGFVNFNTLTEHPLSSQQDREFYREWRLLYSSLVVACISALSLLGIGIYETFIGLSQ